MRRTWAQRKADAQIKLGRDIMSNTEGAASMRADVHNPIREEPMMQFFDYAHLREELQGVSSQFHTLAAKLVETLPRNPERTVALRKLLESKDCAVRALLYK
jgi:hypothetical protein